MEPRLTTFDQILISLGRHPTRATPVTFRSEAYTISSDRLAVDSVFSKYDIHACWTPTILVHGCRVTRVVDGQPCRPNND